LIKTANTVFIGIKEASYFLIFIETNRLLKAILQAKLFNLFLLFVFYLVLLLSGKISGHPPCPLQKGEPANAAFLNPLLYALER